MKYQFVKVAAASPELKVADPHYNAQKIIEIIKAQAEVGTEVLVFPELSLSGYTCGDLFLQDVLIGGSLSALKTVVEATQGHTMLVFVGLPLRYQGKLYNCAAAISNGKVHGFIPKIEPLKDIYERNFAHGFIQEGYVNLWEKASAPISASMLFQDERHPEVLVSAEIGAGAPASLPTRYELSRAAIIVNLSASSEGVGKREYLRSLLAARSGRNESAYIYCEAGKGESAADAIFSGNSMIYENGTCLAESKPFSSEVCEAEIDVGFLLFERRAKALAAEHEETGHLVNFPFITDRELTIRKVDPTPFVPHEEDELHARAELILNMQAHALARRLQHTNAQTAVLGVSGGLDSTLALLVSCRAFDLIQKDRKSILAYTMPGFGTTKKTKSNALTLMEELGVTSKTVPISDTVLSHFKDIGHNLENRNVTYENAQARYRTMVLMDVANEKNGLVIGTGDLSELALGWCTYNGDHMSMYAVNSSVPKTLVKHLVQSEANRLGGNVKKVLGSILSTEISPELLPPDEAGEIVQKTEDVIGPYELHDFYLYHFLRRGDSPAKTFYLAQRAFTEAYDRATLKKWLVSFYKRFFTQQFKRNCVPDGVKIGSVSLSPRGDWNMPSDASAALWIREAESL